MDGFPWIPPFFRDIWSHKTSEILFVFVISSILCLLFSQYCLKSKSPHFSEKSIPGLPRLEPHRKVTATPLEKKIHELLKLYEKRPTYFQTLTFWRNLSFQKPWICPWIFQGFSMDFPPHGFSGRPRERPTKIFRPSSTMTRKQITKNYRET